MKTKMSILLAVALTVSFVAVCSCDRTEKTIHSKDENVTDTTGEISAYDYSSDVKEETSKDSVLYTSEESTSNEVRTYADLSIDDMEKGFLDYCDEKGIQYNITDENGAHKYSCVGYHFVLTKYADEHSARNAYQEVVEYGGWYEEDLVTKEVCIDEERMQLRAYHCQTDGGDKMLFVLAYKENLFFSIEGVGNEKVTMVEEMLHSMGIDV